MQIAIIIAVLNLAAKYGIDAVVDIFKEWRRDGVITLEDVQNMEQRFKDPESYFKKED